MDEQHGYVPPWLRVLLTVEFQPSEGHTFLRVFIYGTLPRLLSRRQRLSRPHFNAKPFKNSSRQTPFSKVRDVNKTVWHSTTRLGFQKFFSAESDCKQDVLPVHFPKANDSRYSLIEQESVFTNAMHNFAAVPRTSAITCQISFLDLLNSLLSLYSDLSLRLQYWWERGTALRLHVSFGVIDMSKKLSLWSCCPVMYTPVRASALVFIFTAVHGVTWKFCGSRASRWPYQSSVTFPEAALNTANHENEWGMLK